MMVSTSVVTSVSGQHLLRKRGLGPPSPIGTEQADSSSAAIGEGRRIFVIDDEDTIADSLAEILKGHGFDAVPFYEGKDAIDSARERCPDIVLSDVIMPRLNGIETVLAIRQTCPAARIVLFSGQAGTADILRQARADGHEFELLPKPLHPEQLLRQLKRRS